MNQPMRIVIWGINYAPEPTGIAPYTTDLARHLHEQGMEVSVVTGFQYYPAWRKAAGDRWKIFRRETIDGVRVHRCWQYVPSSLGTLRRVLHEASFVLMSLLRVFFLRRADLYIVISPPLGLGPAAWLATRLKRSRYLFHVQDLQPDTAAGLGMMKAGAVLRLLYACESFAYRHAAGVSGIAAGMVDALRAKNLDQQKVFLQPNRLRPQPGPEPSAADALDFRARHGIAPEALVAVYSGNIGRKQGLEVLLDAAETLGESAPSGRPIVLVIAGDGAGRATLAHRLVVRPQRHVRLLPLQSAAGYAAMLRAADVALITQMPGTGQFCFPSKLLSVLAAGRPVIAVADETSDLARAVAEGGFGCQVPATDAQALARVLRTLAARPEWLAQWAAGTQWVERFSPELMLSKFVAVLRLLVPTEADDVGSLTPAPRRANS